MIRVTAYKKDELVHVAIRMTRIKAIQTLDFAKALSLSTASQINGI